jgi:hypothetical protein
MLILFSLSLFGIFLVFIGYPLLLLGLAWLHPRPHQSDSRCTPSVTLIVAYHGLDHNSAQDPAPMSEKLRFSP